MNTLSINIKREYELPRIECVKLDNDISLAMESDAPVGPEEGAQTLNAPNHFCNDPFKTDLG